MTTEQQKPRRRTSRTPNQLPDGRMAWERDDAAWAARGRQRRLFHGTPPNPPAVHPHCEDTPRTWVLPAREPATMTPPPSDLA
jgi:hypothetical protein